MGAASTYENKLLRYLNRTGVKPLEAVHEFIVYVSYSERLTYGVTFYPEEYLTEENHYLKVVFKGWIYEFRSPKGSKKWIFLHLAHL